MIYLLCWLTVAGGGNDMELTKALRAVTTAANYQFTVEESGAGGKVEGKFQKDSPICFLADRIEFFRKGDVLVYKQGDNWQKTRTGTLSDPLAILGASMKVRTARLPHEELAQLEKGLTKIRRAEEKDKVTITGDLSEKTARELARSEDRDLARGGTTRLVLDSKGNLTGYEIAIVVKGRLGNAEVDGVKTRAVTLGGIGSTKFELPTAAKKALEAR